MRNKRKLIEERGAVVERLRKFLRLNYVTTTEMARQLGVRDRTLYLWLKGDSRLAEPWRITAFLDSLPAEKSGITPTGYEYREDKLARNPQA